MQIFPDIFVSEYLPFQTGKVLCNNPELVYVYLFHDKLLYVDLKEIEEKFGFLGFKLMY